MPGRGDFLVRRTNQSRGCGFVTFQTAYLSPAETTAVQPVGHSPASKNPETESGHDYAPKVLSIPRNNNRYSFLPPLPVSFLPARRPSASAPCRMRRIAVKHSRTFSAASRDTK